MTNEWLNVADNGCSGGRDSNLQLTSRLQCLKFSLAGPLINPPDFSKSKSNLPLQILTGVMCKSLRERKIRVLQSLFLMMQRAMRLVPPPDAESIEFFRRGFLWRLFASTKMHIPRDVHKNCMDLIQMALVRGKMFPWSYNPWKWNLLCHLPMWSKWLQFINSMHQNININYGICPVTHIMYYQSK